MRLMAGAQWPRGRTGGRLSCRTVLLYMVCEVRDRVYVCMLVRAHVRGRTGGLAGFISVCCRASGFMCVVCMHLHLHVQCAHWSHVVLHNLIQRFYTVCCSM